jgi:hypothetical protein
MKPPTNSHSEDHGTFLRKQKIPLKQLKKKVFQKIEKELSSYVLEKTYWNFTKAKEILEISYKALLTKIDEVGLNPNQESVADKLKYLGAMEEAGFMDSEPEVFQFIKPIRSDKVEKSVATS